MTDSVRTVSLRAPLARLFGDYNPFYLLSAMCMLAGLFSLNNSLDWSPLPEHNLLYLLIILNIYEAMLVGLGIFLSSRGLMRDAGTLFILEAFFLVDAGFLNAEIFTADFTLGLGINIALFFLAALKLAGVFHALRISLSDGRYPLILSQMLVLLTMPGVFKSAADGNNASLTPVVLYAYWWVVALIPLLYLIMLRKHETFTHQGIVGTFVALSFISILAHLCTSNWVYHVRWNSANLSPLLLGLAAAIGASDRHVHSLAMRMRLHLLLPVLALILAMPERESLNFFISDMTMTPLRLALLVSAMVYFHGLLVHQHPYFAIAGILCSGAGWLGESPEMMTQNAANMSMNSAKRAWRFVPTTLSGWGMVSVGASFVLLLLGLLVSLLKPSAGPVEEEEVAFARVESNTET